EVHHQPRRQRPQPHLPRQPVPHRLINQARRHRPPQHPQPGTGQNPPPRRQPPPRHGTMSTQRGSSQQNDDLGNRRSSGSLAPCQAATPASNQTWPNRYALLSTCHWVEGGTKSPLGNTVFRGKRTGITISQAPTATLP